PRGLGCVLSVARADRSLSPQQDRLPRRLFRHGTAPRLGRRADVVVADHAAAPFPRRDAVRAADAAQSVRLSAVIRERPGVAGGAICRTALRGLSRILFPCPGLLDEETRQPLTHRIGLAWPPFAQTLAGLHAEFSRRDFFAEEGMRARGAIEVGNQHFGDIE